jgi:hypothetical protein
VGKSVHRYAALVLGKRESESCMKPEVTEEQVLAAMLEGYREHVQKLNHEINKLKGEQFVEVTEKKT